MAVHEAHCFMDMLGYVLLGYADDVENVMHMDQLGHRCINLSTVMWCWIQSWFDAYANGLMLCLVADVSIDSCHDVMVLFPGCHSWYARYHGVIQNVFVGCYAVEYTSCYWGVLDAIFMQQIWGCYVMLLMLQCATRWSCIWFLLGISLMFVSDAIGFY